MAEYSLAEVYGASSPSSKIPPSVQAKRDAEGVSITAGGENDTSPQPRSAASQAADRKELLGEIAKTKDPGRKAILQGQLDGTSGGKEQTFSLEDVYGTEPHKERNQLDIALGGVAAGGKAILNQTIADGVAIGDLVLSVPSMVAGAVADTTVRLGAVLRGMPHREASALAAQARQDAGDNALISPNPISKALAGFGLQADASGVTTLLGKITDMIGKGGEFVDKKTGGTLNKDDVESIANMAMATLGAKGAKSSLTMKDPTALAKATPMKVPPAERVDPTVDSEPPPTEEAPPPPPADSPTSRAKDDIERTMNIKDPAEEAKVRKTRRAQARAAFKDDQAYAEYLSKHADEEANVTSRRAANEESQNVSEEDGKPAEGSVPAKGARVRKGKGKKEGQVDNDLLGIMALGGAGAALAYAYPDETKDATTAAFGAGLVLRGDLSKVSPDAPIGAVLGHVDSTLKTLERLPENRSEFTTQMVREQLKRDDVSKSEKDILGSILDTHEGPTIKAKELVQKFQEATGNFRLTEKQTNQYADYGLSQIDRAEAGDYGGDDTDGNARPDHPQDAVTSIWQLPEGHEGSSSNHFGDSRYFGHTRSFTDGGVKHVVEIQSDLVQHAKPLSEEKRATLAAEHRALDKKEGEILQELDDLRKERREFLNDQSNPEVDVLTKDKEYAERIRDLKNEAQSAALRLSELTAALGDAAAAEPIKPMLKNWDRRLVREELAESARRARRLKEFRIDAQGRNLTGLEKSRREGWAGDSAEAAKREGQFKKAIADTKATLDDPTRVRFATADTVAKVEGWPTNNPYTEAKTIVGQAKAELRRYEMNLAEYKRNAAALKNHPDDPAGERVEMMRFAQAEQLRGKENHIRRLRNNLAAYEAHLSTLDPNTKDTFRPEHQGIYDRYKKDTEKFLRGLGGVEHTDEHGHTWIEVATKPGAAGRRAEMFGGANQKLLSGMAAVGLGLAVGSYLDPKNPIEGAILGVIAGAAIVSGAAGRMVKALRDVAKADTRIRINDLTEAHQHALMRVARTAWQFQNQVLALVPKRADRVAIFRAIKANNAASLSGKLGVAAEKILNYKAQLAAAMPSEKTLAVGLDVFDKMAKGSEDIAELVGMYGNALGRAAANEGFLNNLKAAKGAGGQKLVQGLKKAPVDYVSIDNPQFANVRVHSDIAPSLKFMFEAQDPGMAMAAISMVNTAIKRTAVSFSLFHVKSLFDAGVGAFTHPLIAAKVVAQGLVPRIFGLNRYLKQLRDGGAGDLPDRGLAAGLVYSFQRMEAASEDVGGGFYQSMRGLQTMLDAAVPKLGTATVGTVAKINHAFDNMMWGRIHAGFKLEVFASKSEALMKNAAKSGKPLSQAAADKIAASYANYVFGGLNWQRMAEAVNNRFGRDLALSAFSPSGRRVMQILAFAPDWTISTTMALTKVVGKGDGVKGLISPKTAADLHRQQLVRSAFYYAVVGNALNYAFTGHNLWDKEQKDWTRIELGDGRTMQLSKHFTEPFHWAINPGQQAMNKLGFIPREALTQSLGVEYLSAKGHMPPMKESPGRHLLNSMSPIGAQQFRDGGVSAGLSGALGVPIYGKTDADRRKERFQRTLDHYKKAMQIK